MNLEVLAGPAQRPKPPTREPPCLTPSSPVSSGAPRGREVQRDLVMGCMRGPAVLRRLVPPASL